MPEVWPKKCTLHSVPPVQENEQVKLYWDQYVVTRRKLRHYRPDHVIFDNVEKRILVVEFSCTWFTSLNQQYDVKYHKYATNSMTKDVWETLAGPNVQADHFLKGELGEMYGQEYKAGVEVLLMVIGVCGEIRPGLDKDLVGMGFSKKRTLNMIERMQRAAVLGTSRLIRAHLSKSPQ